MKTPLRLLLVEDSEDDALFLLRELERANFAPTTQRVISRAAMESALREQTWDLVVSDHALPGFGSFEALRLTRKLQPMVPFIVVSGVIGEDIAVAVMKAGADDYVMKSNMTRLVPSIERELRDAETRRARKNAEEALQRSQQELEDFFDHAPVGLRWMGPDGTILRANDAELEMLGYSREEYVGKNIADFLEGGFASEKILERLGKSETLIQHEVTVRCKNGMTKHVLLDANALWENDRFIHARCFSRDITLLKREQEVRQKLIEELTEALGSIKTLKGLLPICASCKKIRDDRGYWQKVELYISEHTGAEFTHGICPECVRRLYPEYVTAK